MANLIRIRRGLKENLPELATGEMAITLDTNELFVGVHEGNFLINDDRRLQEQIDWIMDILESGEFNPPIRPDEPETVNRNKLKLPDGSLKSAKLKLLDGNIVDLKFHKNEVE